MAAAVAAQRSALSFLEVLGRWNSELVAGARVSGRSWRPLNLFSLDDAAMESLKQMYARFPFGPNGLPFLCYRLDLSTTTSFPCSFHPQNRALEAIVQRQTPHLQQAKLC